MHTTIRPIGNSRGITIPKAILELCEFDEKVVLSVEEGKLIVSADKRKNREGWEEQLAAAYDPNDELHDDPLLDDFDGEWTWEEE